MTTPPTTADTLKERGSRYGAFLPNAQVSDALNQVVTADAGYQRLAADQREAIRQIFLKISRVITGDPNYDDNWRDIAGYATLVLNRLTPGSDPGPVLPDDDTTYRPGENDTRVTPRNGRRMAHTGDPDHHAEHVAERLTFSGIDTAANVANWIRDHGGQATAEAGGSVMVVTKPGHLDRFSRGQTIRKTRKGNWKITP